MCDEDVRSLWCWPYRWWFVLVVMGYAVVLCVLRYAGIFGQQWLNATTAYFVLANLIVLWWYADATWRQLQLNQKDYIERNKPVVFTDRLDHPDLAGNYHYVIRNVGGGFAVNVYYYAVEVISPISIGALAAGAERPLPSALDQKLRDGGSGLRHLIVAEAPYSRTTQWTPTLNLRTQTGGDHGGQVMHQTAKVKAEPPRFQHQNLQDYMQANAQGFREQIKAFREDDMSVRLLDNGR